MCRNQLEVWNKREFRHVGLKINELQKRLGWLELQAASPAIISAMRETQVELNCWLDRESAMWFQRSRVNWFQAGDQNTRYFHARASSRHKKNSIIRLLDSNESFDEEKVALVVTISWSLWSNRNSVRHGGTRKTPETLVQWASHYLIDYAAATDSNAVRPEIVQVTWTPPPPSVLKINVDGALSKPSCSTGIRVVIWDDARIIVAALSKHFHVSLGPLEVEAKSFEAGLQLAWDLGLQNVALEGDSLVIVHALCGQSNPPSSVDSLCIALRNA
nr:hypothetical protein CFP56_49253 [Quercus suber]